MSQPVVQPGKRDEEDDVSWLTDVEPAENRYIKKMKQNPFVPVGALFYYPLLPPPSSLPSTCTIHSL